MAVAHDEPRAEAADPPIGAAGKIGAIVQSQIGAERGVHRMPKIRPAHRDDSCVTSLITSVL